MDEYSFNAADDELDIEAPETPEDVAVLYTWANVHGGKYRDFSASRREFRAQQRHRMVEQQREAELEAARAREEAAALEMEEVRRLEEQARHDDDLRADAEAARRRAEENIELERQAAQHHVEVAEELKRALDEAQREMEEARRRAEDQAARYAEADARYRASARQEVLPGEIEDPYYYAGPLEPTAFAPGKGVRSSVPQRVSSEKRIVESYYRSKGSSDSMPARVAEESYGLFSSRPRGRSSAGRLAYTEASTPVRRDPPFAEARTETPEDTRERQRTDELDRITDHRSSQTYDDNEDDGYYDGVPVNQQRSTDPSARNSAPSNVYLAPRVQQAPAPPPRAREEFSRHREEPQRPREESGERRSAVSEDPAPGSPHMLEQTRARRRESAADVAARTTRRPRESGVMPVAGAAREDVRTARTQTEEYSESPRQVQSAHFADSQRGERAASPTSHREPTESSARRTLREPSGGRAQEPEERPEWLLKDSPSGSHKSAEHHRSDDRAPLRDEAHGGGDDRRYSARGVDRRGLSQRDDRAGVLDDERARRGQGDSQMIPAADGGFNLPPLPDRAAATERSGAAPSRSSYRDRGDSAIRPVVIPQADRAPRSESLSAAPVEAADSLPQRPSAERRRTDRHSGERSTRELRVPQASAPAEQEPRERRLPSGDDEGTPRPGGTLPADTLQQSRERVAARWFALKGLMGGPGDSSAEVPVSARAREMAVPILAVVSLSGGVGKTSLVATVGRTLSSVGERVLLADATQHSLLPFYFGARELRPDVVRTFSPPPGSKDAPVFMVNYQADRLLADEAGQTALLEEIGRHVKGAGRMLLDLNATSAWLARRLAGMNSTILVPVAADMNSVLGIKNVERFFSGLHDSDGRPQMPYYILNQFDASLPLHLDVREVLRQQLGDRLLPIMIRRSPSVAEALAEGMTVMDYAPESPVTEDYAQLADWVRKQSAPAQTPLRGTRWSER